MATGHEFINLADLASARVGGRAIATNDDFFAPKSNLVKPEPAVFIPGKYTTQGQVDGRLGVAPPPRPRPRLVHRPARYARHRAWRERRHEPLHRQLSVALLDRSGGHHPRGIKPALHAADGAPWTTLLGKTALRGNGENLLPISDRRPWTHLRLSIYPDGGVARLRVFGEVAVDWSKVGHARRRSRADYQWRPVPRRKRSALRHTRRADHARPCDEHGRRVGDAPPSRSRPRLGDRFGLARRVRFRKSRSTQITSRATIQTAPRSRACSRRM